MAAGLNQAEIEIGMFSRQCLGKRRIPDLAALHPEAAAWKRRVNREQVKIDWRFDGSSTAKPRVKRSATKDQLSCGQRSSS